MVARFGGWSKTASLPGSDALKKGRSGSQASMSAHDRAMVAYVGMVGQLDTAVLREAIRPFRSVPRCG
jgi:hypothetical protein